MRVLERQIPSILTTRINKARKRQYTPLALVMNGGWQGKGF